MSEALKCTVRDGKFVEPCKSLDENCLPPTSRVRGITVWCYVTMPTLEPSRTFYGIKSKANPDGLLFNHCPFCGEDISAPFVQEDAA